MKYDLVPVDSDLLDRTEAGWLEQIEAHPGELPYARFLQFIDWSRGQIGGAPTAGRGRSYCYALVKDDQPTAAVALVSVSYARPETRSPWLKVLEMRLEPRLDVLADDEDVDEDNLIELSIVLGEILLGSFKLAHDEFPSKELKVYGEQPATKQFMEGIATNLRKDGLKAKAHGNWLILQTLT